MQPDDERENEEDIEPGDLVIQLDHDGHPHVYTQPEDDEK